jgi:hypothetical protein
MSRIEYERKAKRCRVARKLNEAPAAKHAFPEFA